MLTRTFSCLLFAIFFLAVACKKNHDTPPAPVTGYKLQMVSGGSQTDTIGQILPGPVNIVLVRGNAAPPLSGYLRFETMSCDNTPFDNDIQISYANTDNDSIFVSYSWQLNQTIGIQTAKVILLDSVKDRLDSMTVTATGIAPASGWNTTGCILINTYCTAFAQLPSGRVFTAIRLGSYQSSYPYYSDDDGATWHALTSFPVITSQINTIVTTKDNEVFMTIPNTGIYYSNDGGQTWQQRSTGLPLTYYSGNLACTATGILIALSGYGGTAQPYYSPDKGVTWQVITNGILIGGPGAATDATSSYAASMTDGTIVAILNGSLRESRDGGVDWTFINTPAFNISNMIVDSNNYIFAAVAVDPSHAAGIYESKDTGQTWTSVYNPPSPPLNDMSVSQLSIKNGFYYFYATSDYLLTQTSNFITYNFVNPPVQIPTATDNTGRVSNSYIVTNDNHFILSTPQYGLFYQVP